MITQHGALCDVCGDYILPIDPDEQVNLFTNPGIEGELCCHNKCKDVIGSVGDDWRKLPDGPLRKFFEVHMKEEADQ
jgi:hypothetical protein